MNQSQRALAAPFFAMLLMAHGPASDDPIAGMFGVASGMPAQAMDIVEAGDGQLLEIAPPTPDTRFGTYVALATPQAGLCKFTAVGTPMKDMAGQVVRQNYADIQAELTALYGAARLDEPDLLDADGSRPEKWVRALLNDDGKLETIWLAGPQNNLPDGVDAIQLTLNAVTQKRAYIALSYQMTNFDACTAERSS
ncbi:hypothetical protein HME9302_01605 [Alteripontixanthobacter maritimus]|uniref:Uncharacterized protein n=1 Tax=Alteripontixanthobacter maritimus TaxID=2161824 RepID=A0A369QDN7_9SPHN|nr:hypothetical protein [Alteripontixanthobacter maritimus]RDC60398.1 hypothetical protein HME9302_01605 [Alteripontixanthobacter maritimus]